MDLGFLNVDLVQIVRTIKNITIKILIIPFKVFNSLPWYVKGFMYFIVLVICLLILYAVWKNRDEWLRVNYEY